MAMGMLQRIGITANSSSVKPGPEPDTMVSKPKAPPQAAP
jgi:hypothetical protein